MAPRRPKSPNDTPSKPAAKPKPVAKPKVVAKPAAPTLRLATAADAPVKMASLKLKDLIASVAEATGTRRPDAKKAVEATLTAIADALSRGADLNLPPLGRMRVARAGGKDGTGPMTLKLRQPGQGKPGAKSLADDTEDS